MNMFVTMFEGKRYGRVVLLGAILALLVVGNASAYNPLGVADKDNQAQSAPPIEKKKRSKSVNITTEFGLGVGAHYNWFSVYDKSADMTAQLKMTMSYGAAFQFRINIGRTFGIQPEVTYSYGTIRIKDEPHAFSTKARLNLVQVPLLLSLRIAMFRINAGPVFTLMDTPSYNLAINDNIEKCYLGRIYPTVTYAVGASVKFAKCMMIDLRYTGPFMKKRIHGEYLYSLDQNVQAKAQRFNNKISNIQLRFGYVF